MGNISSPVITRLGINQWWYHHWTSDTIHNFNRKVSMLSLFLKFFNIYFNYGLVRNINIFRSEYFFKKNLQNSHLISQKENFKWFRRFFFIKKRVGLEYSYTKRHQSGEYFPFKTWVIIFRGWVVFSIKWFKPFKARMRNFNKSRFNFTTSPSSTTLTHFSKVNYNNRFKVLMLLVLRNIFTLRNEYCF